MTYVILVIIVILVLVRIFNNGIIVDPPPNPPPFSPAEERLQQEAAGMIRSCYNEKTQAFDWNTYFSERDGYLYCGYPSVTQQMKWEMDTIGHKQAVMIAGILDKGAVTGDFDEARRQLKAAYDTLLNLEVMCGGGNREDCPIRYKKLRKAAWDFLFNRAPYTKAALLKVTDEFFKG